MYCSKCGEKIDSVGYCLYCESIIGTSIEPMNQNIHNIRNPSVAAVLSCILPGLGHIYNGQIFRGTVVVFSTFAAVYLGLSFVEEHMLLVPILLFLWWYRQIYTAYKYAEKVNSKEV
jgi:TM2 domain-containing membrane protein YozV